MELLCFDIKVLVQNNYKEYAPFILPWDKSSENMSFFSKTGMYFLDVIFTQFYFINFIYA